MLIIRKEQMAAFEQAAQSRFEQAAVEHFYTVLPTECKTMGDEKLRRVVRAGINKGRTYGLRDEYDYLRLLNLMFVFGIDFDQDQRLAWAQQILYRKELDPRQLIDLLMQKALDLAAGRSEQPGLVDVNGGANG